MDTLTFSATRLFAFVHFADVGYTATFQLVNGVYLDEDGESLTVHEDGTFEVSNS